MSCVACETNVSLRVDRFLVVIRMEQHVGVFIMLGTLFGLVAIVVGLVARFDPEARSRLTDRGDDLRARFVVMAMGPINTPKVPRVPGIGDFRGTMFHTARWDYSYTGGTQEAPVLDQLADKRVAIVGTGASAIQAVPYLGRYAEQLYVLQRTASTVDQRRNTPTDTAWASGLAPGWQRERQMNFHRAAIDGLNPGEHDRICDIWTEINRNLSAQFTEHGWPQSPDDFLAEREVMDYRVMERLRARVDSVVTDRETAEILKPWYRHMCKRPASSDDFYPTFNRPM